MIPCVHILEQHFWYMFQFEMYGFFSSLPKSIYSPDSKVDGANMGPTWVLSAPDGPHVGPINLAIREVFIILWGVYFVSLKLD